MWKQWEGGREAGPGSSQPCLLQNRVLYRASGILHQRQRQQKQLAVLLVSVVSVRVR